jgi:hypothetical protein
MTEILLAFLFNFQGVCRAIFIISLICLVLIGAILLLVKCDPILDDFRKETKIGMKKICKICLWCGLLSLPISLIPNMDDIWKIRINLIKFELASPENIEKATGEITQVVKKLECKYLDLCEEPEKKPD